MVKGADGHREANLDQISHSKRVKIHLSEGYVREEKTEGWHPLRKHLTV